MSLAPSEDGGRDFMRGNPFARAFIPQPDDEKATSPVLYVVFGLLSLFLAAVFVAAMVLPPLFIHTLVIRGIRLDKPGMWCTGLALGALYFWGLIMLGRRLMRKPPPDEKTT